MLNNISLLNSLVAIALIASAEYSTFYFNILLVSISYCQTESIALAIGNILSRKISL